MWLRKGLWVRWRIMAVFYLHQEPILSAERFFSNRINLDKFDLFHQSSNQRTTAPNRTRAKFAIVPIKEAPRSFSRRIELQKRGLKSFFRRRRIAYSLTSMISGILKRVRNLFHTSGRIPLPQTKRTLWFLSWGWLGWLSKYRHISPIYYKTAKTSVSPLAFTTTKICTYNEGTDFLLNHLIPKARSRELSPKDYGCTSI